ncbi:GPI ethanolamine phosphate transferase 2-like [Lytechinus variegatus]|uniref:GPI ethanolamine phosphate transferase 2-like n=1 Tax=Lytechinus variegatus TaxID=7654 RepID=UPI001BB12519|nr:GPI ethanolamine phosphate transferase 2-like [Lytechinus variegatus]
MKGRSVLLLTCVLGEFFGLAIFLKGFFPLKAAIPGHATFKNLPSEPSAASNSWKRKDYDSESFGEDFLQAAVDLNEDGGNMNVEVAPPISPSFGKVVIMLIDGLRSDFVLGERGPDLMPFTRELIDRGETKSFVAKAHVPTVTMPRIKGLTTGTVPGFIDFVINLDSKALQEDNIILQMYLSQKRIHLYGDDTWMRMFPGHFHKTDGTTSFFVTDYTEVDNNVTRNVEPALKSSDWDTIILHYLGLDHIGHLGGPYSPLVKPKLREMDNILKMIHQTLLKQDVDNSLPSLLVLCGDHGMSEAGSHGGASKGEVLTPLVFISSAYSGGKGLQVTDIDVQQIDLAPTLSLLLGHPIPQNSLGCAITQVLNGSLTMREQLRALQINGYQLMAVHQKNAGKSDEDARLKLMQAVRLHSRWLNTETSLSSQNQLALGERTVEQYVIALHTMRDGITSSLSQYDMHAMASGMLLLWMVFFLLVLETVSSQANRPSSHLTNATAAILVCCLATSVFQIGMCSGLGGENRDVLCSGSSTSLVLFILFVLICGFCMMVFVTTPVHVYIHLVETFKNPALSITEVSLIAGSILHTYSLASSSFVEEEHQTWYFNTMTLMLGVCLSCCAACNLRLSCIAFLCTCLMRVLRAWNQTGVEWVNVPDIGDWFVRPENKAYLSTLLPMCLIIIYITMVLDRRKQLPFMIASFLGTVLYRNATGATVLPITIPASPKGILEAWFTYATIIASLLATTFKCFRAFRASPSPLALDGPRESGTASAHHHHPRGVLNIILEDTHSALLMLVTLILRPHNSAVVAILVMLQYCLHRHLLPWLQWKVWVLTVVHVWMGQAAFYAQGNSNNAASMDISAGYVGLDGYNLVLAGSLTFISTYAGPLLWFTKLADYLSTHHIQRFASAVEESCYTLALSRGLPIAAYTILATIQRYHLFVWSVFSPKLLYDGVHTSLICGLILLALTVGWISDKLGVSRRYKEDLYSR